MMNQNIKMTDCGQQLIPVAGFNNHCSMGSVSSNQKHHCTSSMHFMGFLFIEYTF